MLETFSFSAFLLLVPRLMTVILLIPFFSDSYLPRRVRTGLVMSIVVLVYPILLEHNLHTTEFAPLIYFSLIVKEAFLGLLMGVLAALPFWIASSMGLLIDMQRGAFSAQQFSPMAGGSTSPLGVYLSLIFAVLFLVKGGFLILLKTVVLSYKAWPVTQFVPNLNSWAYDYFASQVSTIFYLTVLYCAPVIIFAFLVDLIMGLLNRFVPQIPVFFLSLPIKSALVLFVLSLYIFQISDFLDERFLSQGQIVPKLNQLLK